MHHRPGRHTWPSARRIQLNVVVLAGALVLPPALGAAAAAPEQGDDLYSAAREGDVEEVRKLLEKGADVGYTAGPQRWTALHLAAHSGHAEIAQLLIDGGADLAAQESKGWTALHLAAYQGHATVVETLLSAKAPVHVTTAKGFTALDLANSAGHTEIAALIAAKGGSGKQLGTRLYNAAAAGQVDEVGRLLAQGAGVEFRAPDRNTPLHVAAFGGHLEVVHALLVAGADAGAQARYEHTPLTLAAQEGHATVVSTLAEAGADVDVVVAAGRKVNALSIAAERGHLAVVRALLEHGAAPNGSGDVSQPPLFEAVSGGHQEVVTALVESGADVNPAEDWVYNTALHTAVRAGDLAMVELLLGYGARPQVRNYKNQTPLDLAVESGNDEIARLLRTAEGG